VQAGLDAGRIDAVIANAGVKEESVGPGAYEALKRTFAVNVFGAVQTATAILPAWGKRGGGRVIFISSQGRWHGMARTGAYNASKAALSIFAESMAMDLRAEAAPIRITLVEPGLIRTGMVGRGMLQNLLSVDTETAARNILQCAARGCLTCRFPFLFTMMTAAVAVLPMGLRVRVLGRVKGKM
jgi:NAD(P)-dependent dehydrogenase (short-subunit alcohol dehydrogenase family)